MLIGVVGKPSSGKSTFFRASTLLPVEIGSRPFVTIKPNQGIGFVRVACPEKELGRTCTPRLGYCKDGERFVPVDLLDVAGLVPGAHKGEGMGLQFMNDLNMADCLVHIVDAAGVTDAKGNPTEGYDPVKDVAFLEEELDYWYLSVLKKGWDRFSRKVQMEKQDPFKAIAKQLSGMRVDEDMVKKVFVDLKWEGKELTSLGEGEMLSLARELRKRSKPILIVANKIDLPSAQKNLERLNDAVPCSAEAELALREAHEKGVIEYLPGDDHFEVKAASEKQKDALSFIQQLLEKRGSTGVQTALNTAVFKLLGYKAVFPGGVHKLEDREGRVLADCFLMPPGSTALDFAFRLHTDFGKGFIKAINVKTKMPVGRDYLLKDGDVIEIMAKK